MGETDSRTAPLAFIAADVICIQCLKNNHLLVEVNHDPEREHHYQQWTLTCSGCSTEHRVSIAVERARERKAVGYMVSEEDLAAYRRLVKEAGRVVHAWEAGGSQDCPEALENALSGLADAVVGVEGHED